MSAAPVILVVDDDAAFTEVLGRALERRGYTARIAASEAGALAQASQEPLPWRAVVDLRIGEESGLDVVRALRQAQPTLAIVVLTGYASIATAVEAMRLGAVNYLTKPADADQILAAFDPDAAGAATVPEDPLPLQRVEWEHIQRVLTECEGNISEAARRLGLHRRTLQRKLLKRPSGLK